MKLYNSQTVYTVWSVYVRVCGADYRRSSETTTSSITDTVSS